MSRELSLADLGSIPSQRRLLSPGPVRMVEAVVSILKRRDVPSYPQIASKSVEFSGVGNLGHIFRSKDQRHIVDFYNGMACNLLLVVQICVGYCQDTDFGSGTL